jgi:hypothetical protein
LAPGVESAAAASLGGDPEWDARLVLFDHLKAHLSVQFDPTRPTLQQWRSRSPEALAIANGRLVLFASQWPAVRHEVGRFFAEKLGALEAVNLDGGPEATLALRGEAPEEAVGSAGTGLALVLVLLPGVPATPKASR